MLSKSQPVGIMIYGNAELIGVPWESIIKSFRKNLDETKFNTLTEYADYFIEYLNNNNLIFSESMQKAYVYQTVSDYFNDIVTEIKKEVRNIIAKSGNIDSDKHIEIIGNTVKKHCDLWIDEVILSCFSDNDIDIIIKKYESIIKGAIEEVFEKLPLEDKELNALINIASSIFIKDRFYASSSGIVIAGFGEDETFPALISLLVDGLVDNKLKYKIQHCLQINTDNNALIVPFAQSDMVYTFMEGIDPEYKDTIQSYISQLLQNYPTYIVECMEMSNEEKDGFIAKLQDFANKLLNSFDESLAIYRNLNHVNPITQTVAFLPKDELAAMAESLVNLTSLKRRISLDAETVGGPIDVAVISKGEGFIWIKRKHYFNADLNHHYIAKLYNKY